MLYFSNFVLELHNIIIYTIMKKTIIIFVLAALIIFPTIMWVLNDKSENILSMIEPVIVVFVVSFAIVLGIRRLKSLRKNEPTEDELSKKIMTRASSLSYYISLYFWLILLYFSDRISLDTNSIIGNGIVGMAVIFVLSWLGIKAFGMKNL